MQLIIKATDWQTDRESLEQIRRLVFIEEQNVSLEDEWDDQDESAIHFLAINNQSKAVACARVLQEQDKLYHIGRVAVLAEFRNQGIGRKLMQFVIDWCREKNPENDIYLHAQTTRIQFYKYLGFKIHGHVFMDAGIEHIEMWYQVNDLEVFKNGFHYHLSTFKTVKELYVALKNEYDNINKEFPWCNPFSVTIEETRDHITPWYYHPDTQSKNCVVVRQNVEVHAIWKEEDLWSLDDESNDIKIISNHLCQWKALDSLRSVRGIKFLIEKGFWLFDAAIIPKLSGAPPDDMEEVISWDLKNILAGTKADNLYIVTREEWDRICKRPGRLG